MIWYIIGIVVLLIIQGALASVFADYAERKGYERSPYFWACFLLGVAGYCMVAALPDLVLHDKLDQILDSMEPPAAETEDGTWICCRCQTENSSNYSQCKKCGTFRS